MDVSEDVEKLEPLCIVDENISSVQNYVVGPQNVKQRCVIQKSHLWIYTQKNWK